MLVFLAHRDGELMEVDEMRILAAWLHRHRDVGRFVYLNGQSSSYCEALGGVLSSQDLDELFSYSRKLNWRVGMAASAKPITIESPSPMPMAMVSAVCRRLQQNYRIALMNL